MRGVTTQSCKRAEIHQVVGAVGDQLVAIDFAVGRGQRAEVRFHAVGQGGLVEFLLDALPGPIVLHALFEQHLHDRQPEDRPRADLVHAGNAAHDDFQGDRHLAFHFLRGAAGVGGDDLDHLAGDVGIGVDLLVLEGPDAQRHEPAGQHQDEPALTERQADQGGNHRPGSQVLGSIFRLP